MRGFTLIEVLIASGIIMLLTFAAGISLNRFAVQATGDQMTVLVQQFIESSERIAIESNHPVLLRISPKFVSRWHLQTGDRVLRRDWPAGDQRIGIRHVLEEVIRRAPSAELKIESGTLQADWQDQVSDHPDPILIFDTRGCWDVSRFVSPIPGVSDLFIDVRLTSGELYSTIRLSAWNGRASKERRAS